MPRYLIPLLQFAISTLFIQGVIGEHVPVYIWGSSKPLPTIPALTKVRSEDFQDMLEGSISKETKTLLFAESTLSMEDFSTKETNGKPVFSAIFDQNQFGYSTYMSHVKNAIETIKILPDRKVEEVSISDLRSHNDILQSDFDTLIISFDDIRDDEDRTQTLERHVGYIESIYQQTLVENKDVLAILTGDHSSWVLPGDVQVHRQIRAVEDATNKTNATGTAYKNPNILIYLTDVPTFRNNGEKFDNLTVSTQAETNTSIVIKLEKNKDLTFRINSGYWYLDNITVYNQSTETVFNISRVFAPITFSYHCNKQTFYSGKDINMNITFPGLQLQPYLNASFSNHTFGDAFDCVGFSSIPIWSGLFVTFILAIIMAVGISMMMSIKTMDRFDDPKGKTITISATE